MQNVDDFACISSDFSQISKKLIDWIFNEWHRNDFSNDFDMSLLIRVKNVYIQKLHDVDEMRDQKIWANVIFID
jgi:hypothetical protein